MNYFFRFGSYLFHPLLMPLAGTALYYMITPKYVDSEIVSAKILAVTIITLFVPLVSFFLLRSLRLVSTIQLQEVRERKLPLMLHGILVLLIIKMVFDPYDSSELYYFFVGVLFSTIAALFMVFFGLKVSLHQMGIAGVTMFLIGLSAHFQINMLAWIMLFFVANGWVASSRIQAGAHNIIELTIGLFIGFIPQLILLNFWL